MGFSLRMGSSKKILAAIFFRSTRFPREPAKEVNANSTLNAHNSTISRIIYGQYYGLPTQSPIKTEIV